MAGDITIRADFQEPAVFASTSNEIEPQRQRYEIERQFHAQPTCGRSLMVSKPCASARRQSPTDEGNPKQP